MNSQYMQYKIMVNNNTTFLDRRYYVLPTIQLYVITISIMKANTLLFIISTVAQYVAIVTD